MTPDNAPEPTSVQEIAARASEACREGRVNDVRGLLGELYARGVVTHCVRCVRAVRGNPVAVSQHELESELWIHLQQKIFHFNPDIARFELWLARVAHNLLIDLLRNAKRKRMPNLEDRGDESGSNDPDVPDTAAWRIDEDVWRIPFSAEDWKTLASMAARNSIDVLLIVVGYGYSRKLTSESEQSRVALWRGWFAENGIDSPDEFLKSIESLPPECTDDRIAGLIEMLPMLTGSARQRWNRCRHRVTELTVYWGTWLRAVMPWSDEQFQLILQQDTQTRVPVLCVDQRWHRSGSLEQWMTFSGDFKFRGHPPLLRFLEESNADARQLLFAHCLHGDPTENLMALTKVLDATQSFRQRLRC